MIFVIIVRIVTHAKLVYLRRIHVLEVVRGVNLVKPAILDRLHVMIATLVKTAIPVKLTAIVVRIAIVVKFAIL